MKNPSFSQIDRWAKRLLAPADRECCEQTADQSVRAIDKLFALIIAFLGTGAISLALFLASRRGLVPLFTILCITAAATARERRKYWMIGVFAAVPVQILVALLSVIGH
jgi:hypothetical protein